MGQKGQVVIREQQRPVQHLDWLKPSEATKLVADQIPYDFRIHHFALAWRKLGVRPRSHDQNPERTDQKYLRLRQATRRLRLQYGLCEEAGAGA